jgi:1,4-dihydroxy-2-naphthoate octaprenyltransferase
MPRTPPLEPAVALEKLATYEHQVLTWVDDAGYPISVAVAATIDPGSLAASFAAPAGLDVPTDREVSLTGSHIRPISGYGYDERRHVTVWGRINGEGPSPTLVATAAWGWDEQELSFFEYSERSVGQSRRYFDAMSLERGTPVRPRLARGWLALRATRLPFLTATLVPVLIGIAIAATHGPFDPLTAVLTIIGGSCIQIGLNVANDVFDTTQGADDVNVTPTKYSGGSRVIQYGLVSLSQMQLLATGAYVAGIAIGLVLVALSGSMALLAIGIAGVIISLGYTAPPLKLVYRGLGEIAVALGFGPLMLVGAYVVQSRGQLAWEPIAASIPIGLLVALILYVNEIPDRRGDATAGKRTLPVRLGRETIIRGYLATAVVAYLATVIGVMAGVLPLPALALLVTIPMARSVYDGLRPNYDNPYALMAVMATNIKVHAAAGAILLLAYAIVLLAQAFAPSVPLFIG